MVEDSLDKPFLLLTGSEPDFQWQRFQQAMLGIAQRLQPSLVVFISAFPMPVPHTRPVPVTAHGSRKDLIDGISAWRPKAELHANMTNLLEVLFTEHGFDTVGFGVNVPQYISDADLPQGTLAAVGVCNDGLRGCLYRPISCGRLHAPYTGRSMSRWLSIPKCSQWFQL